MKKALAAIVLCALLSSAFAKDSEERSDSSRQSLKDCKTSKENNLNEIEEESSEETVNTDHLSFKVLSKENILIAANESTDTVPILDYQHNVSIMFNGKSGDGIFFDFEKDLVYHINRSQSSHLIWDSSQKSFEEFFKGLPAKDKLYRYVESHGTRFDPSSVTEDLSDKMGNILSTLSLDYSSHCESLATFLYVSKITAAGLRSSMGDFFKIMDNTSTSIRGDFKWVVGIYQGMRSFFDQIKGGMSILTQKRIKLDYARIVNEKSGIHVLIYFLEVLSKDFDVGKILGTALNNEVLFFNIIDKLSGEVGYDFDGFIHLNAEIVKFIYQANSIQNVESTLRKYLSDPRTNQDSVKQKWKPYIRHLRQRIEKLQLTKNLEKLTKLLKNIENDAWEENEINMTKITNTILEGTSDIVDDRVVNEVTESVLVLLKQK